MLEQARSNPYVDDIGQNLAFARGYSIPGKAKGGLSFGNAMRGGMIIGIQSNINLPDRQGAMKTILVIVLCTAVPYLAISFLLVLLSESESRRSCKVFATISVLSFVGTAWLGGAAYFFDCIDALKEAISWIAFTSVGATFVGGALGCGTAEGRRK